MTSQPYTMRFGPLRRLLREYVGERHVAIVKQLPSDTAGHEWYEFEERPGPGPELKSVDNTIVLGGNGGTSITVLFVGPDEEAVQQ